MIQALSANSLSQPTPKCVGGGGAGGVGMIQGLSYYSGGGGASGAAVMRQTVNVITGDEIHIHVGKGGSSVSNTNGTDTMIVQKRENVDIRKYIARGGTNGFPRPVSIDRTRDLEDEEVSTAGGTGGESTINTTLSGTDGEDGLLSNPSFEPTTGGSGGSSFYSDGGEGGDESNTLGGDGTSGSGGGGSVPITRLGTKLSGDGGDGFVLVEFQ